MASLHQQHETTHWQMHLRHQQESSSEQMQSVQPHQRKTLLKTNPGTLCWMMEGTCLQTTAKPA